MFMGCCKEIIENWTVGSYGNDLYILVGSVY